MEQRIYDGVVDNPIIAAVKSLDELQKCIQIEEIRIVFILFGDINQINKIVNEVKNAGKMVMVHLDLLIGISAKEAAVDFIKINTMADGIISTKPTLIRRAKEIGLCTVLRFFVLDSLALENVKKQVNQVKPDFIEVLPGVMPKIIKKICGYTKTNVIAGGLITEKEDIVNALDAGAIAVSSTNVDVWNM